MRARSEIDSKNTKLINKIISNYPVIINGYVNSMARKTSYTKLSYTRYVCNFLNYINNIININIYDDKNFKKIKPMHIDSYMEHIKFYDDGKEKSGMYRAAQLSAIKNFFDFLKRNRLVLTNPCDGTDIPKDNKQHEIITISNDDINIIMSNIENGVGSNEARQEQKKWKNRDKAIILLGITTGLRIGAIVGIDIDDIDLDNKTITVTEKGNIDRTIYFGDNTKTVIENWLYDRKNIVNNDNERAMFVSRNNTRMSTRNMEHIMKRLTNGIDKKITPHKMRATCATKLYEKTGDIYLVQQQLGHKSIKNTERYAKVSNERRIQAANILDSSF